MTSVAWLVGLGEYHVSMRVASNV